MKKFFTKKRIIWSSIILVILAIIGYAIFKPKDVSNILTEKAVKKDLQQTVLATGQVTSSVDLDLNFRGSGSIARINVKVGEKVRSGQILATLVQTDQLATLTSARGALASANANYQKVLAGASSEELDVAQKSLDAAKTSLNSTKKTQDVLVSNAFLAMMNTGLTAVASDGSATATVTGTYNSLIEGEYKITTYSSNAGNMFTLNGLEVGGGSMSTTGPVSMGTRGLYIQFVSGITPGTIYWTLTIPNKSSSTYLTYSNAYKSALESRDSAIASAQAAYDSAVAAFNLKKAQARPADVQAAQAQVLSAQGQVQSAQSALENTIIRAPASGTITAVNIKIGEQASATVTAIVLQDVNNLYLEANISEANVSAIEIGQEVNVTFDALGSDKKYTAKVSFVDPASNVIAGIVNYKVTSSLDNIPEIKPGMTANLSILTATKPGALSVSQRAIVSHDGKKFVRIIKDTTKKTYEESEVTTGLDADGGLVEITFGLSEGTEIVSFIQQ